MMALYKHKSFQPLGSLVAVMRLIGKRHCLYRLTHWDGIEFLETTKADRNRPLGSSGNLLASSHSSAANSSWLGLLPRLFVLVCIGRLRLL